MKFLKNASKGKFICIERFSEMNSSMAQAQQQPFNPWILPDSFTVHALAPDDVQAWLHPHWQSQKAVHPIYSYFIGLYFLVMGVYSLRLLFHNLVIS